MTALRDRLGSPGPKRILALDGGGIRGALLTGYLGRIEAIIREQQGDPKLKLRDYFDLIGGTSTGAIIAAGLALGLDADEAREGYLTLGPQVFARKQRGVKRLTAKFGTDSLEQQLQNLYGDHTLGDPALTTGLCIVAKRADTQNTWPLLNHPDAQFYDQNRRILLRTAVRASTAAPVYFRPEALDVGFGELGAFVDGGVSMYNNPALLLFLIATLSGFPFQWPTGEDRLLLVSVGTGAWSPRSEPEKVMDHRVWDWATEIPGMLMRDASQLGQLMLQYLGRTPTPWEIDREIGDLSGDQLGDRPLLTYLRYNMRLDEQGLAEIGLPHLNPHLDSLRLMDVGSNAAVLTDIGQFAAAIHVKPEHFPQHFAIEPAGQKDQ